MKKQLTTEQLLTELEKRLEDENDTAYDLPFFYEDLARTIIGVQNSITHNLGYIREVDIEEYIKSELIDEDPDIDTINQYLEYVGDYDSKFLPLDSYTLDDVLSDKSPTEIIEMWTNDSSNDMDDEYFQYDGSDIETYSLDQAQSEYGDDTLQWMIDNRECLDTFTEELLNFIEEVTALCNEYEVID